MTFAQLVGNDRIKRALQRAISEGRIAQSLLMAGSRGVGKYQFAVALAQALNCASSIEGDACGVCVSCLRIERNEHADVRTILREVKDPNFKKEPKSQFIRIDQMRLMSEQAQFRPYEGRRRVFIIDEAEWLRLEAANSILKTLEEPPATSLVILITSKPYSLLETIRSRCQMLSFAPVSASEIEERVLMKKKMPAVEAKLRSRLSQGSIGRALEIDLDAYREVRERMLAIVETLCSNHEIAKLLSASEHLGRRLEKEDFEIHLDTLMVLLSDLFRLKLNPSTESLTNADIVERLKLAAEKMTRDQISTLVDRIEETLFGQIRNVNKQLAMDSMLMRPL
jgi:DNA polymerase-3 subunit delta'